MWKRYLRGVETELVKYGNVEPLCELIETGNYALWRDKKYRDLICRIIRGGIKSVQKGRANPKLRSNESRNRHILDRLYYHKGRGVMVWGRKAGEQNACELVSREIKQHNSNKKFSSISASAIHKKIWQKHKPSDRHRLYVLDGCINAAIDSMDDVSYGTYEAMNEKEIDDFMGHLSIESDKIYDKICKARNEQC
jgi:hypothetical protein